MNKFDIKKQPSLKKRNKRWKPKGRQVEQNILDEYNQSLRRILIKAHIEIDLLDDVIINIFDQENEEWELKSAYSFAQKKNLLNDNEQIDKKMQKIEKWITVFFS